MFVFVSLLACLWNWDKVDLCKSSHSLKALFNNVSLLKNLSCMALHAISVFGKLYKWSPEKKLYFKRVTVKIDKWPDSPYSFFPIDYCVRINGEPDRLFSDDIQS